jgi:hypothetical protein
MHQFPKFTPAWNSTFFGQFHCPSSGVYSLYSGHWYTRMSCRFVDSFRAGPSWSCSKAVFKPAWNLPVPSVQWINSWLWAEELPETCRVSRRSKFEKLVHLFGFIIKKFVTMHGHMNVKFCELFEYFYQVIMFKISFIFNDSCMVTWHLCSRIIKIDRNCRNTYRILFTILM